MKRMKHILSAVITCFLVCLLIANLLMLYGGVVKRDVLPQAFGWSWAVVISGSMEDAVSVNDLVIIHKQKEYKENDIITFQQGGSVVTHRLIKITEDGFVTKGDANNTEDAETISEEDIFGKVVAVVPKVGHAIELIQTPLGMTALVVVGIVMIGVPRIFEKEEEE